MLQQYKIDEFAFILIGSLIFFLGLVAFNYFYATTTLNVTNITTNQTILLSKQFLLDGLEKKASLIEIEDKIYKSLLEEKRLETKIEIPRDEITKFSKLIVDFESEKGISKLYLLQDKNFFPAKKEYSKNEIKQTMTFIAKIDEYDLSPFIILFSVIIYVSIISFLLYQQYPKLRDKIKVVGISIILALLVLFFSFGSIRIVDKVSLNIYGIKDTAEKMFYFSLKPQIYNVTIRFDIGESLRTSNLRIYLNNEIVYDSIPFTYSVRIVLNNVNLQSKNSLKFETSNAKYEIKNLYISFN